MSKYIFNNDTDILEFLEQLRENGIQIWGEGEYSGSVVKTKI